MKDEKKQQKPEDVEKPENTKPITTESDGETSGGGAPPNPPLPPGGGETSGGGKDG